MTLSYFTSERHNDFKAIMTYANVAVFKDKNLRTASESNSQIKLKGNKYYVGKGKKRYLWLATRIGMPTVKDAPRHRDNPDLQSADPRPSCGDGDEEDDVRQCEIKNCREEDYE